MKTGSVDAERCGEDVEDSKSGRKWSTTRTAYSKIRLCITLILIRSAIGIELGDDDKEESTARKAWSSSRLTATHSRALRLECWKRRMSGEERRSEVYWRWS